MAPMREVGGILLANTFEDSKKHKHAKKKSKKLKKEKWDKDKLRTKHRKCLKDDAGCCDSNIFTQMPMIKKRKEKKKTYLKLNEEVPLLLTQHKKLKAPKQRRQPKDGNHAVDIHKLEFAVQSASIKQEHMQPIVDKYHESLIPKDKVRKKKRVIFNLLPEEIHPKRQTSQDPFAVRDDIKAQSSSTDKLARFYTVYSHSESRNKLPFEENGVESQSTCEDINSQDLFITQKSFCDSYVDICSNSSMNEAAALPTYQQSMLCRSSTPERPSCKQTVEASTQTENFFTPAVATSFRLHNQNTGSMCMEEAMDLSLPNRARQEHQYDSKPAKYLGHPELKITDDTSSNDSSFPSKAKADLTQLKVVQTRLNESFFFKVKGEGDLPKPRSPLMKLTRNEEKNSKK